MKDGNHQIWSPSDPVRLNWSRPTHSAGPRRRRPPESASVHSVRYPHRRKRRARSHSFCVDLPLAKHAEAASCLHHALLQLVVAVAQTQTGLTGALLRVGSERPKVVARSRRALPALGVSSPVSGHHSIRSPGFRRGLCATATVQRERQCGRWSDARSARKAQAWLTVARARRHRPTTWGCGWRSTQS
jgi:hypothetical protein